MGESPLWIRACQKIASVGVLSSSYFTEGRTKLHRKAIGPLGPMATLGMAGIPVSLKKHIATCDFQRGSIPLVSPLDLLIGETK